MANIMQNRVDAILDEPTINKIHSLLFDVQANIPDFEKLTLTPEELGSMASLDVDNKIFVEDAIEGAKLSGNEVLPRFVDVTQIERDLKLSTQMDQLELHLSKVLASVDAIRRIAASEAYGAANFVYGCFDRAATAGVPGALPVYDKLKERYKRQGGGGAPKHDEA